MPTVRHKVIKRHNDPTLFTEWHRRQLRLGSDFFSRGYGDNPDVDALRRMRDDWKRHRAEIVVEHIDLKPCSRPWAWWVWDAPEPRRLLPDSINKALGPDLFLGAPRLTTHNPMTHPICETELDYLERLGLLTPREQRYLESFPDDGLTEEQARHLWEHPDAQPAEIKKFRKPTAKTAKGKA